MHLLPGVDRGVGPWHQDSGYFAVHFKKLAVGLGTELDPPNITYSGNLPAIIRSKLNDDILELAHRRKISLYIYR